jgi:hypothetical protein
MIPKDPAQLALFIQRFSGIGLFFLLFIQILVGRFVKKSGLYYLLTALVIGLIFTHVFAYVYYAKIIKGLFDPFYPFTDICLLCKDVIFPEYYINIGRIAIWIMGLTTLALFTRFSMIKWLNMIVFLLIALHILFLGGDYKEFPLNYFFGGSVVIVTALLFQRIQQLVNSLKKGV